MIMKKSLINWKIDDESTSFEILPVSKDDIESMIDITKSLTSTFTSSDNLDFSFFDKKKDNFKTKVGLNKDGNKVFSIVVKWYLKDSLDFEKPDNFRVNNITNDVLEHVSALIFFEKIGEIDIPTQPIFLHREGTVRDYNTGPKRSMYQGISNLLREVVRVDESEIFFFTSIVTTGTGVGDLWTLKILIPEVLSPGMAKDSYHYFTLPHKMIDDEGKVN